MEKSKMKLVVCPHGMAMVLVLMPILATAQQTATPGPEHRRLDYFVGSWDYETKGKASGTWTVEKTANDFFLRASETYRRKDGTSVDIGAVIGYNAMRNVYTWYRYFSNGYSDFARGWFDDDTLALVFDEEKQEGKNVRKQVTLNLATPAYFTFKWERSVDGSPWTVISEGTATKVK